MDPVQAFARETQKRIAAQASNLRLQEAAREFFRESLKAGYSYNFTWLGRPVIQYPQDILVLQEIIYRVNPEVIIETGIAHGGTLIFSASILELLGGDGMVAGIDVEIRAHNRRAIEEHPLAPRITLIEGSSVDPKVIEQVAGLVQGKKRVLIYLDSDHSHTHVLKELQLYSPFVTPGSFLIVFDTVVEDMPQELCADRHWGRGNSPMTAVEAFMAETDRFVYDPEMEHKALITVAPKGFLYCVR